MIAIEAPSVWASLSPLKYILSAADQAAFEINAAPYIQAALDTVAQSDFGGGVRLPPRAYRITQSLFIAPGVVLEGTVDLIPRAPKGYDTAWPVRPGRPGYDLPLVNGVPSKCGAVIVRAFGDGTVTGPSPIVVEGSNGGVRNLTLFDANQNFAQTTPTICSPFILFQEGANQIGERLYFYNAYWAIRSNTGHGILLRDINMTALYRGIVAYGGGDVARIHNIHCGPYSNYNTPSHEWSKTNLTVLEIGRQDEIDIENIFGFEANVGLRLVNTPEYSGTGGTAGGSGPSAAWGKARGISFDRTYNPIYIEAVQLIGFTIADGFLTRPEFGGNAFITANHSGNFRITGMECVYGAGPNVVISGGGKTRITDCSFSKTGGAFGSQTGNAVGIALSGNGHTMIEGCRFDDLHTQTLTVASGHKGIFSNNSVAGAVSTLPASSTSFFIPATNHFGQ